MFPPSLCGDRPKWYVLMNMGITQYRLSHSYTSHFQTFCYYILLCNCFFVIELSIADFAYPSLSSQGTWISQFRPRTSSPVSVVRAVVIWLLSLMHRVLPHGRCVFRTFHWNTVFCNVYRCTIAMSYPIVYNGTMYAFFLVKRIYNLRSIQI